MNETQKRIKAYQAALPGLRERVVAVALLLAMSAAMMTSASFAWLTISRRPEVTAVNTTVAANGNLEIALVQSDGAVPGESAVGDSSAAEGQEVTDANITWGNLVNLSDPSYGLENLTMRPAQLNTSALLTSPLYGAVYTADGRIERLTSNFSYTQWVPADGNTPGYFGIATGLGVRAISSTKLEALGGEQLTIYNKQEAAESANMLAANQYIAITQKQAWMESLANVMGSHMTSKLNSGQGEDLENPTVEKEDLTNLIAMYEAFLDAFEAEAEALAQMVNLQLFLLNNCVEGTYVPYTAESLLSATTLPDRVKITDLNKFRNNYNQMVTDLEAMKEISANGTVRWKTTLSTTSEKSMFNIVNSFMDINQCTLDGTKIGNIGASNATGYLNKSCEAVLTNGIIWEFERRTGANIRVGPEYNSGKGLKVKATVKRGITVDGTIYAIISTDAPKPSLYAQDMEYTLSLYDSENVTKTYKAQDTYGLAVDLWVRTNAAGSYLTLEGNILTDTKQVRATGKDANGNTVELYTLARSQEITTEETNPDTGEVTTTTETVLSSMDVYQIVTKNDDDTETVTWYSLESHVALTEEDLGDAEPIAKMDEVVTVIGYEGENRVWSEKDYLSTDATTQGSGSCYVYYADTPEDQARSLKLLEAFNVAFVDDQGQLLGTAVMDTASFYAENGRVTVPLVLRGDSINLGEDSQGNTIYAITALEKNVATRITAIVYLDGTKLTNEDVLSAADIQGQLNIQFGSSSNLSAIDNETLESQERRVSASVDKTEFDYDTATEDMLVNVTVSVDGAEPSTVTAFFMRSISQTQGSREETMTFTKNSDGTWSSSYKFTNPGTYVLRTVRLDGVDCDLSNTPTVTVKGFAVSSLTCQEADANNHVHVMTVANSSTVNLSLKFATDQVDKMPSKVQGRYLRSDGTAVNVDFSLNPTTQVWSGSATFLTSGDYTLQYLVLDGEYMELDAALHQTATLYLGMQVAAYTNSPTSFKYLPSEMTDEEKMLAMQVKIMDNTGTEMIGLSGVKLTYGMKGSAVNYMDADLKWNGSYYVGSMQTKAAGTWQFRSVTVGENTLTSATISPTFSIISPEPPSYVGFRANTYQYVPNGGAKLGVELGYAGTASVFAKLSYEKNGQTGSFIVQGKMSDSEGSTDETGMPISVFYFTLPNVDNTQDGNWTMDEVYIWDFYDKNSNYVSSAKDKDGNTVYPGNYYNAEGALVTVDSSVTAADPMLIDMRDQGNYTKAVQTVNVTFAPDQSKDFTGNNFMVPYTLSGLNVEISDFEGMPVQNINSVTLSYSYDNNSQSYGHYTSAGLTNTVADFSVTLAQDAADGTYFEQAADQTLLYAGSYTPTFSFMVGNTLYKFAGSEDNAAAGTKKLPANTPVFTVSSNKPTVTISSVSSNASTDRYYLSSTPSSLNVITGSYNRKIDDYNAVVYMYVSAQSGSLDQEQVTIKYPTVTLSLSDMPTTHDGVTMVFPSGNNTNSTFTFAAGGTTAKSTIGAGTNGVFDEGFIGLGSGVTTWPKFYPAGKQTVSQITVNYGGMVFDVTLSDSVTINNPQCPLFVDFNSTATNGMAIPTVPSRIYATTVAVDEFQVTLPGSQTWTEDKSTTANEDFTVQSGYPTTRNVYTERSATSGSGCNQTTTTYYTPYIETTTVSKASSSTTTWTRTWTITGWKVGSTTYKPGETITITSSQTITAVLGYTDGAKTTTSSTTTRTVIAYTANGSETTTKPSGSKVDSVTGSTTDVVS